MNPPSALHGAMSRDRKPFTYTPGGLDLSEIKSERMAARLMRNAMNQGVPELPPQHHIQSPPMPSTPIAVPNFNCLPVQVFPTFNLPANPKSLLRTRSNPGQPREAPVQRVPPPQTSQFVNNSRATGETQYDSFNKNTSTYSQINNNRPATMYEYGAPASTMNYGSDGYAAAFPDINYNAQYFQMPKSNNNSVIKSVAPPVQVINNVDNGLSYIQPQTANEELTYRPFEASKCQGFIKDSYKTQLENNEPFVPFTNNTYEGSLDNNIIKESEKAVYEPECINLKRGGENKETVVDVRTEPSTETAFNPEVITEKPFEDLMDLNKEKKEVKVVQKQVVKKENEVEEHKGSGDQNGNTEVQAVIKLPSKKSAAKTETKVEVFKKTLPDGSIEEVKKTTTKTTLDGKTEIKTKTETTIIPKDDEEGEVEEVEEEEDENGEVQEPEEVVEEAVIAVKKSANESRKPKENGQENIIKTEEKSETTTTTSKKVTVVQDDQDDADEEEVVEEEEIEEAEPLPALKEPEEKIEPEESDVEPQEEEEEIEEVESQEIKEQEVTVGKSEDLAEKKEPTEEKAEDKKEPRPEPEEKEYEEVEEEEEYQEAEEKESVEKVSEIVAKEPEEKNDEEGSEYGKEEAEPEKEEVVTQLQETKASLSEKEQETEINNDDEKEQTQQESGEIDDAQDQTQQEIKENVVKQERSQQETKENDDKQEQTQQVTEEKQEIIVEKEELKTEKQEIPEEKLEPKVIKVEVQEQRVPLREPSVPLEKVEDVEIKPIGAGDFITKTHTENTEIITNVTDKPTGLLTEINRIENIVTVNRTIKTLDQSYDVQQGAPIMKTYFSPHIDKITSTSQISSPYQPVYPPQPPTERRHSLLLERLSVERQMPSEIYQNNYQNSNQSVEQQRQWSQEPQAEVLTVSNVKPSQITNQQWYQQRENNVFNNATPSPQPAAPSWTQTKPQAQPLYQPQSQYQPPPTPQPQQQPQSQYQPSYTDTVQESQSSTYQNTYSSYTPKPATWSSNNTSAVSPLPTIVTPNQQNQYSYLNKDSSESYQQSTQHYSSSSYVPPPWEQDSTYVAPDAPQNFYQPPPQTSTYTPAPKQGWNPNPPTNKFSKPKPSSYIPPKPNQSFVMPVTNVEPPKMPGRKTYYSEYERRYISVPESTYIPAETKYQPQPDPSPKYYYDNNEPAETVEPQWRKELREFTEKAQTQTETNVKPPWEQEQKYAKAPDATYTPTPTWSQTVRPQSWRERSFESEFVSQEWPKTNTLGRGRPLSSYGKEAIPERTRGVSVDRYNPNSYQAPLAAEHPPVQTHTHIAPAPLATGYHNPNVPAYHARASAEPREHYQQPRHIREARASPFQSRSFKYLQWITGTED